MSPIEKKPVRHFVVTLLSENGDFRKCRIRADTICEPETDVDVWYIFKLNKEVVGKVVRPRLAAWHVEEVASE